MPCGSCAEKLAKKLMQHHRIDMIRAYELAEKGVERVENRGDIQTEHVKSGNPTDYTRVCTAGTCVGSDAGCTKAELPCTINTDCTGGACTASGVCGCPAPLVHSHQISACTKVCSPAGTCAKCVSLFCSPTCSASCLAGTCGYDCDAGYVWNPVTLQCVVPGGGSQGNFMIAALSAISAWRNRRRKRRFIATLK